MSGNQPSLVGIILFLYIFTSTYNKMISLGNACGLLYPLTDVRRLVGELYFNDGTIVDAIVAETEEQRAFVIGTIATCFPIPYGDRRRLVMKFTGDADRVFMFVEPTIQSFNKFVEVSSESYTVVVVGEYRGLTETAHTLASNPENKIIWTAAVMISLVKDDLFSQLLLERNILKQELQDKYSPLGCLPIIPETHEMLPLPTNSYQQFMTLISDTTQMVRAWIDDMCVKLDKDRNVEMAVFISALTYRDMVAGLVPGINPFVASVLQESMMLDRNFTSLDVKLRDGSFVVCPINNPATRVLVRDGDTLRVQGDDTMICALVRCYQAQQLFNMFNKFIPSIVQEMIVPSTATHAIAPMLVVFVCKVLYNIILDHYKTVLGEKFKQNDETITQFAKLLLLSKIKFGWFLQHYINWVVLVATKAGWWQLVADIPSTFWLTIFQVQFLSGHFVLDSVNIFIRDKTQPMLVLALPAIKRYKTQRDITQPIYASDMRNQDELTLDYRAREQAFIDVRKTGEFPQPPFKGSRKREGASD